MPRTPGGKWQIIFLRTRVFGAQDPFDGRADVSICCLVPLKTDLTTQHTYYFLYQVVCWVILNILHIHSLPKCLSLSTGLGQPLCWGTQDTEYSRTHILCRETTHSLSQDAGSTLHHWLEHEPEFEPPATFYHSSQHLLTTTMYPVLFKLQ